MTTTTQTRHMPNYVVQSTQVTAEEVGIGDLLVEVLAHHGIRAVRIEAVVRDVVEGPTFSAGDADSRLQRRVRILTAGSSPLLPATHPVVVRRHVPACQHHTTVDNEDDNGWTQRCLDCGARNIA